MMPAHLNGKTELDIMKAVKNRHIEINVYDDKEYIEELELLLSLAVKDALMNTEEVKELVQDGEYKAQSRAIVFLERVLGLYH